jgi:hypothetical protein
MNIKKCEENLSELTESQLARSSDKVKIAIKQRQIQLKTKDVGFLSKRHGFSQTKQRHFDQIFRSRNYAEFGLVLGKRAARIFSKSFSLATCSYNKSNAKRKTWILTVLS